MSPFRQLHHRHKQLEAVRNIGVKLEHPGLVHEADLAIRKIEWFASVVRPTEGEWLAGKIGPNDWGAQWDSIVSSAKLHREYERRMK